MPESGVETEFKIDPLSPFYLGSHDIPGIKISSIALTQSNYEDWSRDIRMSLKSRRKFGFCDGSIKKPTEAKLLEQWEVVHCTVVRWIRNMIDPSVLTGVPFVEDASVLWRELAERFAVVDGTSIHSLKTDLGNCKQLKEKDRELGEAHAEIKGLRQSDRLKEKAVEELNEELHKVDGKLKATQAVLDSKNLEIKKINEEKKAALAAQFAAEATLRRVHAAQKDDDMPPIEAIIAPLEAELKLARQEIAKLQDDNKALDRLTKSKEAALLEAEKTVQMAMAKASLVDDLQNKNQELMKQIEICQEENKILDKMHRQKVAEVEKLTQTVRELEEAVLAGGAAANAVRDYQRKMQEINDEKKILDRELARAKVTANRVATVVANEWKDGNDKVMPVKQWLEERKCYQREMQQLRDKLATVERTAKAEAQLKEKYQLRFKVLEEKLRVSPSANPSRGPSDGRSVSNGRSQLRSTSNGRVRRQSLGGADNFSRLSSNGYLTKKPTTSHCGTLRSNGGIKAKDGDIPEAIAGGTTNAISNGIDKDHTGYPREAEDNNSVGKTNTDNDDTVSGALYDMLQKEVVILRKACHEKSQSLKDKDDAIEMLSKKVETLNKAMEVEGKKMRREVAAMEKEVAAIRNKENDQRARRMSLAGRGAVNGSQTHSPRNIRNL